MWQDQSLQLLDQVERQIQHRTGYRVRNLAVELRPERIILRGHTTTYYVKQLAQHSVLDLLPQICLENSISVGGGFDGPPRAA